MYNNEQIFSCIDATANLPKVALDMTYCLRQILHSISLTRNRDVSNLSCVRGNERRRMIKDCLVDEVSSRCELRAECRVRDKNAKQPLGLDILAKECNRKEVRRRSRIRHCLPPGSLEEFGRRSCSRSLWVSKNKYYGTVCVITSKISINRDEDSRSGAAFYCRFIAGVNGVLLQKGM